MPENTQQPVRLPETNLLFKKVGGVEKMMISYTQIETYQQCPYKWYKSYIEGLRSFEKQEATSYGTVIHQMLEYFFKNGRQPSAKDLSDAYNYFAAQEDIPFESMDSMLLAGRDTVKMIGYISSLFEKDEFGRYKKPDSVLSPTEKVLRRAYPIGIEERFEFPYRLPKPLILPDKTVTHVWLNGSIDLHMGIKHGGKVHHYIIDWKSGKKVFDNPKLKHNLQHPIYAFYVMRKYGDGLPDMGIYFFTRLQETQTVKVDSERRDDAIKILNDCFSEMYDFNDRSVDKFYAFIEVKDKDGNSKFQYRTATLRAPIPKNMKPCPSALCYYCDFGKHKKNLCPYSSLWDPSKKKK